VIHIYPKSLEGVQFKPDFIAVGPVVVDGMYHTEKYRRNKVLP
jgi:hypothetical protein